MENFTNLFEQSVKTCWNHPALTDYQVATKTYGELAGKIERLHIAWQAAGLQKGDKIALNARSSSHWVEVFMGALSGGYVSVQLYDAFAPTVVQQLVNHSGAKIVYTNKKSFGDMNPAEMPEVIAFIDTDSYDVLHSTEAFAAACADAESIFHQRHPDGFTAADVAYHHRGMDEVCAIMYTSGSTGNPKGVMLTSRNFSWNVYELTCCLPFRKGENYVSILPYAHIFGLTVDVITPLCVGMHTIILGRMPIPSVLGEIMRAYNPKLFFAVPLVLAKFVEYTVGSDMHSEEGQKLLAEYEQHPEYCAKLRAKVLDALGGKIEVFATGGAAIPPAIEKLLAFQINMPFMTGYGMTECAPLISVGKVGSYKAKSCGEVVKSLEVRIDSEDAARIPGEVQIKGDCVFAGYYKNEEATAATFTADGWFRTGDLGTIDSERTLFLVGRSKNMLLSTNGQNIYPEEIEVLLNTLPYVVESVLVQRGHNLHALIVPNKEKMEQDGVTVEALQGIMDGNIQDLNTKLPQFALVRTFELRSEPFAKTPKGSIKRFMYE